MKWTVETADEFKPEFDGLHESERTEILALSRVPAEFCGKEFGLFPREMAAFVDPSTGGRSAGLGDLRRSRLGPLASGSRGLFDLEKRAQSRESFEHIKRAASAAIGQEHAERLKRKNNGRRTTGTKAETFFGGVVRRAEEKHLRQFVWRSLH